MLTYFTPSETSETLKTLETRRELPDTIALRALSFLDVDLSTYQETKLLDYMKESFKTCSCVCLCSKLSSGRVLESLGIDIGTKELIIKEYFGIFYSDTFIVPPHEVA